MDKDKLKEILEKHKLWLEGDSKGEKADLRSADLRCADLSSADLRSADLRCADLSYANLSYADLRYADLRSADLRYANLRYANLRCANLLTFQHNRDTGYFTFDGYIRIGCEYKSIDEWVKKYEQIGKENGYTDTEIGVYGEFILLCQRLQDSHDPREKE